MARLMPKRTDNEIKNYWNTHLKKRLVKMGIDPVTHRLRSGNHKNAVNLSHMAQWESIRLEAEARLVQPPPKPDQPGPLMMNHLHDDQYHLSLLSLPILNCRNPEPDLANEQMNFSGILNPNPGTDQFLENLADSMEEHYEFNDLLGDGFLNQDFNGY